MINTGIRSTGLDYSSRLLERGGSIVAVPLVNARDHVVAVLSGCAPCDPAVMASATLRYELERMAIFVGRAWIDLLEMARD